MTTREASFDYARLRELAEKATPGGEHGTHSFARAIRLREFQAALSPQAVLALLDELDRLRQVSPFTPPTREDRDRVRRKLNGLDKLRQERDELAAEVERLRGEGEWEYGHRYSRMDGSTYVSPVSRATFESRAPTAYRADGSPYWNYESVRRRKAGPWEPILEGEDDA